jgi:hypothetical protein
MPLLDEEAMDILQEATSLVEENTETNSQTCRCRKLDAYLIQKQQASWMFERGAKLTER